MKNISFILFFILFVTKVNAQLERIAPLHANIYNNQKLIGLNILLNTKDFNVLVNPNQPNKYPTSVQMTHADEPFPPIWYIVGENKSSNATFYESDFLLDFNLQEKTGQATFAGIYYLIDRYFAGYFTFDTSTINLVDSTLELYTYHLDSSVNTVDFHDIQYNTNGDKMLLANVKRTIDGRCLTNNINDSLMSAVVTYIVVLNKNDIPVFIWDPLAHLSPCEMYYEYKDNSTHYYNRLNWSHGNSARWANDGNILYSFRHVGCGKININTGDIMFKLSGKDTNAIYLNDTDRYFLQHDFYQTENGLYSVFSNGDSAHPHMEAILYNIDEINKTAKLVYRYRPTPDCISSALGSVDYINNLCIINKGAFFCSPSANVISEIIDTTTNLKVAEYLTPNYQFSYQTRGTYWNVSTRPKIRLEQGVLKTDSIPNLYNYKWYKIVDTTATLVGNGLEYTPTTGKYVVQAQKDTGVIISYLLSDVLDIALTNNTVNNSLNNATIAFINENNLLKIDNNNFGQIEIYTLNAQLVYSKSITNKELIQLNLPKGIYVVKFFNEDFFVSKKIYIN